jgi:Bacterial toxin 37
MRTFNPFRGKSAEEIDQMFRNKDFEPRGPDPVLGLGGYFNPRTGRSYHIDPGGVYRRGTEPPHVDVNRPRGYNGPLEKRRFPR